MLYKDWHIVTYMEKYGEAKITKKINQLILSFYLGKNTLDIFLESFEIFLYIEINKKHQKYTSFTQSLICICVNSPKIIINNPKRIDFYNIFFLHNNISKPSLLKNCITFQYNYTLIIVVTLEILCYA